MTQQSNPTFNVRPNLIWNENIYVVLYIIFVYIKISNCQNSKKKQEDKILLKKSHYYSNSKHNYIILINFSTKVKKQEQTKAKKKAKTK